MISSGEKTKCLEMKTTKKNTWENHKIDIEIEIKNQFSNTLFFFEFSNTLKQIKMEILNPKTLLKTRN